MCGCGIFCLLRQFDHKQAKTHDMEQKIKKREKTHDMEQKREKTHDMEQKTRKNA